MNPQLDRQAEEPKTLTIDKLVYGGEGLGRLDGQVTLVPYVLPGELVKIKPERVKNGLLRARLPEIVEPSSGRVTARCEYFENCGGCQYQHADYTVQIEQKKAILRETLQRLGRVQFDGEIGVLQGEPWNYRNRIQLHFNRGATGFHKLGSHDICDIERCYISSPLLNEAIKKLHQAAKEKEWPSFLQSLEIFTNETDVQLNVMDTNRPVAARFFEWCQTFLPTLAKGPIEYKTGEDTFRISGGSFFQVNRFLIQPLVEEVVDNERGKVAIDLYSGVGLFSLPLARRFDQVRAVERGNSAHRDLEWNARQAGAEIQTGRGNAEDFLNGLTDTPDLIVADPPRAGLGKQATEAIIRIKAPRVTIVSCDPTTLARDLGSLLSVYELKRLTLIDLFPQTYHIETIAKLERR